MSHNSGIVEVVDEGCVRSGSADDDVDDDEVEALLSDETSVSKSWNVSSCVSAQQRTAA